jgi:hypothetical protein
VIVEAVAVRRLLSNLALKPDYVIYVSNSDAPESRTLKDEIASYEADFKPTCSPACAGSGPPQLVPERGPGHSITGLSATFFGRYRGSPPTTNTLCHLAQPSQRGERRERLQQGGDSQHHGQVGDYGAHHPMRKRRVRGLVVGGPSEPLFPFLPRNMRRPDSLQR